MSRILEKSFKYVPAAETDLKKSFDRIRRELKAKESAEQTAAAAAEAERAEKVEAFLPRRRTA